MIIPAQHKTNNDIACLSETILSFSPVSRQSGTVSTNNLEPRFYSIQWRLLCRGNHKMNTMC